MCLGHSLFPNPSPVDPDGMEDWCESQLDSANIIDDDHDGHGDGDNGDDDSLEDHDGSLEDS